MAKKKKGLKGYSTRSVSGTLRSVKKLLMNVGWTKRKMVQNNRKGEPVGYCLLGALRAVDGPFKGKAKRALISTLGGGYDYTIIKFNDDWGTRKIHVLRELDNAIKRVSRKK